MVKIKRWIPTRIDSFIGNQPQYRVSRWRFWFWLPVMMIAGALVGWLFFNSGFAAVVMIFVALCTAPSVRRDFRNYCDQRALDEFYEMTVWLLAGYQSGKTLENTLLQMIDEWQTRSGLGLMYLGAAIKHWPDKLRTGASGMELFTQLSQWTDIAIIRGFSELLNVSQRHGGSAIEVIQMFHRYLREERLLAKEVGVVISQKKLEHQLVSLAPLFFLAYMRCSAYSFVSPLFETLVGRLLMATALFVFLMMWLWGRRLVQCAG